MAIPRARATAFVGLKSPDDALKLLRMVRDHLGHVTSFELISRNALEITVGNGLARKPLAGAHAWYVLLEASSQTPGSLDDALASVDTYTEERILEELRKVMIGRTTILISHRVSTIRHADQIAVLVHGRIAELGTHDELLALNGYYASLFQKQQLEEELAVVG